MKESEIEDWVAERPDRVGLPGSVLLARQLNTGEARLDLLIFEPACPDLGWMVHAITVVELKRDRVELDTLVQVSRYMNDVSGALRGRLPFYIEHPDAYSAEVRGIVAAPGITGRAAELVTASSNLRYVALDRCPPLDDGGLRARRGAAAEHPVFSRRTLTDRSVHTELGQRCAALIDNREYVCVHD